MSVLLILLISSIMMNSFYTTDAIPVAVSQPQPGDADYATYRWCQIHKGCGGPDYPEDLREACLAIFDKKCLKYDL